MESGTTEATVDPTSTVGRERSSKKTVKVTGSFVHSKSEEASNRRYVAKLQAFLNSYYLANFMAAVVMIDAYCTCVDIDATAAGGAPPQVFAVISDACLVTYTLEVVALLTTFGFRELVNDWMMMLDVVIVGCGWVETLMSSLADGALGFRTAVLRALRLVRIFRLMRLLKRIRPLRELHKLVMMMATCFRTLLWSFLLCFVVMTVWAMLLVEIVYPNVQEMYRERGFFVECVQCRRAVSSVMDANLLLFKTVIAGDSWGEVAVPVIQEHPSTAIIFVGSLLTLVFGVLNLIVAVVVDTFADARLNDVQNLAEEMEDEIEHDRKALGKLFARIDKDGSGQLSLQELIEGARHDSGFQSRLRVMDIDEQDLEQLFHMIDIDQSGTIEVAEFIGPLSRWAHDSKTAPRFIKYNMIQTMHLQEDLYDLSVECFQKLAARIDDLADQFHLSKLGHGRPGQVSATETIQSDMSHPVERVDSEASSTPTQDLHEIIHSRDASHSGSRSQSVSAAAWATQHVAKLDVHQPPSSHQVEFLSPALPEKEAHQKHVHLEAMLDSAMLRLEAKLDKLMAEATHLPLPRTRDSVRHAVGSAEMAAFGIDRAHRKHGKKMLHPEAFRSMYMNHGRQISMLDLAVTRVVTDEAGPNGGQRRRSRLGLQGEHGDDLGPNGGYRRRSRTHGDNANPMSFLRQFSPFGSEVGNKPDGLKPASPNPNALVMDI